MSHICMANIITYNCNPNKNVKKSDIFILIKKAVLLCQSLKPDY